jgi:membrane-bound lytic murein transglycosylase B
VYDNFETILKWNRSVFFAVAVGSLADRIKGG